MAYELDAAHTDLAAAVRVELRQTLQDAAGRVQHCLRQLDDEQAWWRPRAEMNAVGNLVLHLCGNVTQWIIVPIGELADERQRQAEFDQRGGLTGAELSVRLESTIRRALQAIAELPPERLLQPKRVQGFDTQIFAALLHSVSHFQGHTQEIVGLTRQQLGPAYQMLWTPRPDQA